MSIIAELTRLVYYLDMAIILKYLICHGLGIQNLTCPEINPNYFPMFCFPHSPFHRASLKTPELALNPLHLTPHPNGFIFRMYRLSTSPLLSRHWLTLTASNFVSFIHLHPLPMSVQPKVLLIHKSGNPILQHPPEASHLTLSRSLRHIEPTCPPQLSPSIFPTTLPLAQAAHHGWHTCHSATCLLLLPQSLPGCASSLKWDSPR